MLCDINYVVCHFVNNSGIYALGSRMCIAMIPLPEIPMM